VNGGEVEIKNGKLTGILVDNAVDLVKKNIPAYSNELYKEYLLQAQKKCFAAGLTTLDDAGLGQDTIRLIEELQNSGELKMRIYAMISDNEKNRAYFFEHGPLKTDRLNVRSFKVYGDGALGSRGACLLQPYSDEPGHTGFLLHDRKYFEDIATQALEHGFQLCTHAIGDSANRVLLQVYAAHLKGRNDKRWRIEHCQAVDPSDLKLFDENNIIPSVQPTHATSDMYWAEERLGKERIKNAYAYNDLMHSGGIIAFGTDFPVEQINPLYTFYAAVARKDLKGFPTNGFNPENKVERKDALRAMTILAAYSNFEEQEKGSIEQGKFADFVILDRDIMQTDEKEIPNAKVIATYVNGEKVFE
jgi:predicted amidohydrolase YtcJ